LMTTLAAILGMLPLALGIGTGSEMYVPLATTVIGGLATSTMLTLFIVPTVYTIFDDLIVRFHPKDKGEEDSEIDAFSLLPEKDSTDLPEVKHGP
jgi:HAE1 family hydrophobic/amphiphilic exporter-1